MANGALASGQWTIVQGALGTTSGISGNLTAIACPDTTCWAVGDITAPVSAPDPQLIETNSGNGWSQALSPAPSTPGVGQVLNGIACVDANDCWAVGSIGHETLIDEYAGSTWTTVPSPNTPGVVDPELTSVTCVTLTDCWAAGWGRTADGFEQTVVEQYAGTSWTVVASPNTSNGDSNILNGIACVTASDCWAVGGGTDGTPLIEQYNGTAWVIDTDLVAQGPSSWLQAVTCGAANACWAVGSTSSTNGTLVQTLIERFDGTDWQQVPSPSPSPIPGADETDYLYGVTCDTGNECWAVGHMDVFLGADWGWSLIERYTAATGWTLAGFDPALPAQLFSAVGCGDLECAAVGTESEGIQPMIAESPVTAAAVGGSGTTAATPPASSGATGTGGPSIPDTGGAGMPWAPLLIGGGIVTVGLAGRLGRSAAHRS
jgi:hypothetical protein